MSKFGRNKPCWCGSGNKYKDCHYPDSPDSAPRTVSRDQAMNDVIRRHNAAETMRTKQQGEGRPVISVDHQGTRFVATGNTLHYSSKWQTFTDFLLDYIKKTLGPEWGTSELNKPEAGRHTILQWYRHLCAVQASVKKSPDGLYEAKLDGGMICYIGLAYSLYLLKHNAELQERIVARLKDQKQFQGAYYETRVANCLIRAGFELELEDETDDSVKHCEFPAKSTRTGETFWVEAKMRSVSGLLGKTKADGAKGKDATSQLSKHLRAALARPAPDRRMVFIDVNAPAAYSGKQPRWADQAIRRLEAREKQKILGDEAYVFVTNYRPENTSCTRSSVSGHLCVGQHF